MDRARYTKFRTLPDHAVVEQLRRRQRALAIVELGEAHLRIGVDRGLLIDPSPALQGADVKRILGNAAARMLALELPVGFLVRLGLLEGSELDTRKNLPSDVLI